MVRSPARAVAAAGLEQQEQAGHRDDDVEGEEPDSGECLADNAGPRVGRRRGWADEDSAFVERRVGGALGAMHEGGGARERFSEHRPFVRGADAQEIPVSANVGLRHGIKSSTTVEVMGMAEFLEFIQRALNAQEAVDAVLSRERQASELQADNTYRVRCSECGTSVSNPLPVPVIVRAHVLCPECLGGSRGGV